MALLFCLRFLPHTGDSAMKRIERMTDLEHYGIIPLTGESDGHMYRILCDCTEQGKAIIERTLDVQLELADAWNYGDKDDPQSGG